VRYRSLPAECEATQFLVDFSTPLPEGVMMDGDWKADVITAHGQKTFVADGDYIVTEPDGRGYYPVKPDIFEKRWVPA
jgi:hypothetical protein